MNRKFRAVLAVLGILTLLAGIGVGAAQAQYRPAPAPAEKKEPKAEKDEFEKKLNLERYRDGQIHFETQQLIVNGLTALHEEHVEILEELRDLKARIARLEEKQP